MELFVNKSRPQEGVLFATRKPLEEFLRGPEVGGNRGEAPQSDLWPQGGTQAAIDPDTGKYGLLSMPHGSEGGFFPAECSNIVEGLFPL